MHLCKIQKLTKVNNVQIKASVSPQTTHFHVLDKSLLSNPGNGPTSCNSASGKEPICKCRTCKRHRFNPWVKIPWRMAWQPTALFLPRESQGQRSLAGYSPWVVKIWTWLKQLSMHAPILRLGFPGDSDGKESACNAGDPGLIPGWKRNPGEGNGYPLQYSCLENSMNWGVWLATVHGGGKSRTQLNDSHFHFFIHILIIENKTSK